MQKHFTLVHQIIGVHWEIFLKGKFSKREFTKIHASPHPDNNANSDLRCKSVDMSLCGWPGLLLYMDNIIN